MRHLLPATKLCTDGAFDSFLADFNGPTKISWAIVGLLAFLNTKALSVWLRFDYPSRTYNLMEAVTKSKTISTIC